MAGNTYVFAISSTANVVLLASSTFANASDVSSPTLTVTVQNDGSLQITAKGGTGVTYDSSNHKITGYFRLKAEDENGKENVHTGDKLVLTATNNGQKTNS